MVANIYANNAYIVDGLLNETGNALYQSISLYRYLSLSIAIIVFSIGLSTRIYVPAKPVAVTKTVYT